MPNILIRNVSEETKQRLEQRDAKNGRSQNAEAVAILEEALAPAEKTWLEMLMDMSQKYGESLRRVAQNMASSTSYDFTRATMIARQASAMTAE